MHYHVLAPEKGGDLLKFSCLSNPDACVKCPLSLLENL